MSQKSHINDNVLVLNRIWQAVNIVSAKRAFCLICKEHAQAVNPTTYEKYDFDEWVQANASYNGDDVVGTVSLKVRIPKVILLTFYDRLPRSEVKFTRHSIYERDNYSCQYCGKHFGKHHVEQHLNIDHVIPRDAGGPTVWENVVCSCIPCNTLKANRTPSQAKMRLAKQPEKPKWRAFVATKLDDVMHPEWENFMDLKQWKLTKEADKV
jgi:5-methylcytosine-specific restriction endonuclease McrA